MGEASVIGKIIIKGELKLLSPLLIGTGKETEGADIHVLTLPDGTPFIPGTSLAGALREIIERERPEELKYLFGLIDESARGEGAQSSLAIDDIELKGARIVSRDGVSLDYFTGAAKDTAKYDYECVERGAHGALYMELTLRKWHAGENGKAREELIEAVRFLLARLADGIALGAMTAKGLGRVQVKNISGELYDFAAPEAVLAWLGGKGAAKKLSPLASISRAGAHDLFVSAKLSLNSSFIVRDYGGEAKEKGADGQERKVTKSLSGEDREGRFYILPGTTIKGVLRHRAEYILRSLGKPVSLLDDLMGTAEARGKKDEREGRRKSRFLVSEAYIRESATHAPDVTRNRLDRLTGGVMDTALFTVRPVYQKQKGALLTLEIGVKEARDWEIGLALLLLRDVSQGKVAFGGESGAGRGTLAGEGMTIELPGGKTYQLDAKGKGAGILELNKYARALMEV